MKIVCLVNGKLETYYDIAHVPATIDNLIEFVPDYFEPPHTEDQHHMMHESQNIFKQLMSRETK